MFNVANKVDEKNMKVRTPPDVNTPFRKNGVVVVT